MHGQRKEDPIARYILYTCTSVQHASERWRVWSVADIVHSSCAVNDTAHECCPLKLIDCLNWYDANCFLSKVTVHIRLLYLHISSPWVIVLVEVCSLPLLSSHSSTITSYSFQVVSMGSLVCIELLTMPSLLISSPSAWSGLFMKISSSVHLFSVLFTFSCD